MANVDLENPDVPDVATAGGEFKVSVDVDNKEIVVPVLKGGNCDPGPDSAQGELTDVELVVEGPGGNVSSRAFTQVCVAYGAIEATKTATFDVTLSEVGQYDLTFNSSTVRQLGTGNNDSIGPIAVEVVEDDGGGGQADAEVSDISITVNEDTVSASADVTPLTSDPMIGTVLFTVRDRDSGSEISSVSANFNTSSNETVSVPLNEEHNLPGGGRVEVCAKVQSVTILG